VIPDFQRDFEWKPWDIAELMRSIFLDYYIGSLLLWKGKSENFDALACEPVYGYNGNGSSPEHIVLDGQQRLTANVLRVHGPRQARAQPGESVPVFHPRGQISDSSLRRMTTRSTTTGPSARGVCCRTLRVSTRRTAFRSR
jgi:hypothetical protein